jgi:hypothetical protein
VNVVGRVARNVMGVHTVDDSDQAGNNEASLCSSSPLACDKRTRVLERLNKNPRTTRPLAESQ